LESEQEKFVICGKKGERVYFHVGVSMMDERYDGYVWTRMGNDKLMERAFAIYFGRQINLNMYLYKSRSF